MVLDAEMQAIAESFAVSARFADLAVNQNKTAEDAKNAEGIEDSVGVKALTIPEQHKKLRMNEVINAL